MTNVRTRLSIMMFLQYAVWGAWAVSLGGYMGKTLEFSGLQIGSVYSTTAIAAMISPLLMGILADRLFSTEKLIGVLHLLGAVLLGAAAYTREFTPLYIIMIAYSICYMPTLALTNSISFANIKDPESEFPRIRVWGTWGWIIVGWLVGFVLDVPPGESAESQMQALEDVPEAAPRAAIVEFPLPTPRTEKAKSGAEAPKE